MFSRSLHYFFLFRPWLNIFHIHLCLLESVKTNLYFFLVSNCCSKNVFSNDSLFWFKTWCRYTSLLLLMINLMGVDPVRRYNIIFGVLLGRFKSFLNPISWHFSRFWFHLLLNYRLLQTSKNQGDVLSLQLQPEKVINLNYNKKAHNIRRYFIQ